MSAVFGLINLDNAPPDRVSLERMSSVLSAHGRDGDVWLGGPAGLGHRLHRFTPRDNYEQQPLVSVDGNRILVSDARIDDSSLHPAGRHPQQPDSALILEAYNRWGSDCVHHLTGFFAFALWDRRLRTLLIARSPIAAPPICYTCEDRRLAFATMPSALHSLPHVSRAFDDAGLAHLLTGQGEEHLTPYQGIRRLPSGHRLQFGPEGLRIERFWRPDLSRRIIYRKDEDYLEAFGDLFQRVIEDHLDSMCPIALQLSGGLDSSAIAAVAAPILAERNETLEAFTEVPRSGSEARLPKSFYADETPLVEAIAGCHSNISLHLMRTEGRFFLEHIDRLFPNLEAPFGNSSNRVWIESILSEASQRGCRVVLDGLQGNLTLSWHGGGWLKDLKDSSQWQRLGEQLCWYGRQRGASAALRLVIGQAVLPFMPVAMQRGLTRVRHPGPGLAEQRLKLSPIHPRFAAEMGVLELARGNDRSSSRMPLWDGRIERCEALQQQDFGAYVSAYRAMLGVDMRSPTADVRLAEFCLALPDNQFWRDGIGRSLVRRAMVGRLPTSVLENQQRGMQAADWLERLIAARSVVAETLMQLEQSVTAQRVLDLQRMRDLLEKLPGEANLAWQDSLEFQHVLQRGLMIGSFLKWFETAG